MDEMETSFEQVTLPPVRPMLAGGRPVASAAFDGYLRGGVETKALSGNSGGEGGYAVPREIDARIDATLQSISPLRAIANVVTVGSSGYRKLVASGGFDSGWAAETAGRPITATPTFNEVAPPFGELYANPAASQAMLDDAMFDVEAWLAGEIAREFAQAEGTAFVNGTGVNQPKGFLTVPTSTAADAGRAFGTLQYLATGAAGAFAANPEFITQAAPWRYGAMLWQPSLSAGQPATLLGYPVVEAEDMPDIAANNLAIAFGNFQAGYLIAERGETQLLRDPYSNKPFVHFYATKRLGGMVSNSEAIKLLKFAAN